MRIAVEMDQSAKGYASVHREGCRDLKDPETVGESETYVHADELVEDFTGWEMPFHYAPCAHLR